jgi:predicted Zn-dependent protease
MKPSLYVLKPLSQAITLALAVTVLSSCGTATVNPVTGQKERTVMDERAEIAEGAKSHQEVLKEYGELKDPKIQAYVNEIGQRLAKLSERANLQWKFTVLDSPEVNAFALPGGYVYVTRGIMAYMGSEADLAGVIGHEIGHVTARHGAQRATRQQNAGMGVMAATVLGVLLESQGVRGAGQMANQASQGIAAGYVAKYSREQESQADRLGAEYLQRVNFDPRNMIDVIGVLRNQEKFAADKAKAEGKQAKEGSDYLASHPANEQRLNDITKIAGQYKGNYTDEGKQRYLTAINGMQYGESAEQGVVRGRQFFHEGMNIAFTAPPNWRIANAADSLTFISPDGAAAMIVRSVPDNAGKTHEEIIRNVLKPTGGRIEPRTLNGLRASHFVGTRQNENGQTVPIESTVATAANNSQFLFVYASRDANALAQNRAGIQETESSFRPMSAVDKQSAKPWNLKLIPYPRGGFPELARQSPLGANAEQQLRLLNGVYGGGEPKSGELVKTVQN